MTKDDIFYEAILTRDFRFDGKFFAGSKTTWIYCRPICPAKPLRKNVEFFDTALDAERAGYRPCLRCRPESAPYSPAWLGKSNNVRRGLNILLGPEFFKYDEGTFAQTLGISSRHMRRLFKEEVGKTPKQIADTNRLDFARKLITETDLPITKIAYASGFKSVRRFNDSVKKRFAKPPNELRKSKTGKYIKASGINLQLSYRPPYTWTENLRFYRAHMIHGVESVTDNTYSRTFRKFGTTGHIEISQISEKPVLLVKILAQDMTCLYFLVQHLRQIFDLNADPVVISNAFESSSHLKNISKMHPGLRLSRFWDPFEGAICTILGQLVSLAQARKMIARLVEAYGATVKNPLTGEDSKLFPTPQVLAEAKIDEIGTTKNRANAINELSRKIIEDKIKLDSSEDSQVLRKELLSIKGIGPWTADYIALRALGEPDVFPGDDLVLKREISNNPDINPEHCAPYRSYLALYLWHEHIKNSSSKEIAQ